MQMVFDEDDFEQTAKMVLKINRGMVKDFYNANTQSFIKEMKRMADSYMWNNNYFSTLGFVLTAYDAGNERHVKASVTAHLVQYALKQKWIKLNKETV